MRPAVTTRKGKLNTATGKTEWEDAAEKAKSTPPVAEELDFLQYFYSNADFGPANSDVRDGIKTAFEQDTGLKLPPGYEREGEE